MKRFVIRLLLVIAVFAAVVLVLNFGYFWKQIKFVFVKPQPLSIAEDKKPHVIEPSVVIVESLGIKAPLQYVDEANEETYQKALRNGVVHYPGTAKPGEYGNVYIFGHSSDNAWSPGDYKTVFALLPRIEIGAKIVVSDPAGNPYEYTVVEAKVVGARDTQWLDQGEYKKKRLTLQTSYPIGTSLQRYVVIAEIPEDTTPSEDPNAS